MYNIRMKTIEANVDKTIRLYDHITIGEVKQSGYRLYLKIDVTEASNRKSPNHTIVAKITFVLTIEIILSLFCRVE